MRFLTPSCLLCKHNVLLSRLRNTSIGVRIPSRASSLSAIHRGLRSSERARPQGFSQASLSPRKPGKPGRDSDPTFKIKKGKKDITWEGPKRKTRSARFNDPEDSFGKKSLVYQMKHGKLRGRTAQLQGNNRSMTGRATSDRLSPDQFMADFTSNPGRFAKSDERSSNLRFPGIAGRGRDRQDSPSTLPSNPPESAQAAQASTWLRRPITPPKIAEQPYKGLAPANFAERSDRGRPPIGRPDRGRPPTDFAERSDRGQTPSRFSERPDRSQAPARFAEQPYRSRAPMEFAGRPNQSRFADKEEPRVQRDTWKTNQQEGGDIEGVYQSTRRDDVPIRIHHTTAASQFLYGRSVVEAALRDSRRQLYRLYIYNGEDRRSVPQDTALERLAQRREVPVMKVERHDLRMMDKMSDGRPHNGYVLEASPLPQLPLKALGAVSEDPAKPGFSVDITHQSAEEALVNGTSDFISCKLPEGRNPFVLLLDEILDPGNLGAILRSAAFLGVNAVAITKNNSATMTAVALKASSGASEVMTLFSVGSTVPFLTLSREAGWVIYAAVPSTSRSKGNSHLTLDRVETYDPLSIHPTILVVGSEGDGLSKPVRREADFEVSIPSNSGLLGAVDSLNVSVATGILCQSFLKKQWSRTVEIERETPDEESSLW
ncbi:hypothetical protein F5X99DRAFT_185579 [Biscogniauxia marginata]|nr:hypothetical protein F5X99DRAFT_185579 [Biscogniauxia marginata]